MSDETRTELLEILRQLSDEFPEWRMGQMITNLAGLARGHEVESIWDAEDDELIEAARQMLEQKRAVSQST
ncbi:MAG: hypothetical protein DWQ34_08905 [Planctomycetota bacterium]|nr:MAG: hypothetical protein DWQ29_18645 [Planctomycetota bacterium]REJ94191.1 MAG: hypothetical protein DWQ34_08905 [Planctomycetota bacterium]REK25804.1 MAG: hypothetical protein DWQ41_11335 [Planctomycetota bacterium]REK35374.1 MAG: hypothetical protein DWQ45_11675 [Planctomycetota bacterium]